MAIRDLTRSRKTYSFFRSPPVADMGSTVKPTIAGSYSANVLDYGAKGTGTVNDLAAFQLAAASGFKTVFVPQGTYLLGTGSISVANGQTWYFLGSTLIQSGTSAITFNCSTIDDWALIGPCVITGSGNASGTSAAVYVVGCNRFRVEDITAKSISGWGFKQDPGSPSGTSRGDQGQYTNIQSLSCYYGFENAPGTGAEYCTLIAPMISLCTYGMVVAAGNTTVCGGNVVDNTNGIYVGAGTNHAHGIISGVNINHNVNYNIRAVNVTNGMTFTGCHIYNTVADGKILIENSAGIDINNGTIDAPIQCDTGANIGFNSITNNHIPGTAVAISGTAAKYLILKSNWQSNRAAWPTNDKARLFIKAIRSTTAQNIASVPTVLIFNNVLENNRSGLTFPAPVGSTAIYDETTGIFTAPWTGDFKIDVTMTVDATSGLVNSYVAFHKNGGTTVSQAPLLAVLGTLGLFNASYTMTLTAGETMNIRSSILGSPVSPTMRQSANPLSSLTISSVD